MTFKSFIDKLFDNWPAKLLSFGAALIIYIAFQVLSLGSKDFSIPLTTNTDGSFVMISNPPDFVRIELRGSPEDLASIQNDDISAFIDICNVSKEGKTKLPVDLRFSSKLALMENLDIKVFPETVNLEFEEKAVAWVPVKPLFRGKPGDGYVFSSWECHPRESKISGAKSIVEATSYVYLDGVDLNERVDSFNMEVYPTLMNKNIEIEENNIVFLYVDIIPQIIKRSFSNIHPLVSSLSREFVLAESIPSITVELSGEKNQLSNYVPLDSFVEIDFSSVTEAGLYTLPVITNFSSKYTLTSLSQSEVSVEVIETPFVEIDKILNTQEAISNYIIQGEEL